MFNDIIRKKLEELLGGDTKISIEIEPAEKQKQDDELKKQGLAPSNPKKDAEVKAMSKDEEESGDMMPEEDEDEKIASSLMDEDEMVGLVDMKEKPKGLFGKMKQKMAKDLAKKEKTLEA